MKQTRNQLMFAFLMVASLFFIWGFCHAMLDVLNTYFKGLLSLTKMQSGMVQTSVFGAYLLVGLPAALLIRRIGYQRGILFGLLVLAFGAFLFIPAAQVFHSFWSFCLALFVLSMGLATIETAANPYVTVLGPKEGAAGRLSVAQAFNSCAYILAPTVGGLILFGKKADPTNPDFHPLLLPYVILGCVVLVIFGVFSFIKLPSIEDGGGKTDDANDPTINKIHLTRQPHFIAGVITQFLYIVAQIGIGAFAQIYVLENAIVKDANGNESISSLFASYGNLWNAATHGFAQFLAVFGFTGYRDSWSPATHEATAAYVITFGMILYTIGRFSGAPISRRLKPHVMLALYGIANTVVLLFAMANIPHVSWMILPLSFLFMSIMFPFIFAMSVRNLGAQTKIGASFHVIAVGAAGSIAAVGMGYLWDTYHSVALSFSIPLIGFLATAIYGLVYPKLLDMSERASMGLTSETARVAP